MTALDNDNVVSLRNEIRLRDDVIEKMRAALRRVSVFMSDVGAPDDLHEEVDEAIALADGL